jgi:DNA-binding beta-propeller fold protein YncE
MSHSWRRVGTLLIPALLFLVVLQAAARPRAAHAAGYLFEGEWGSRGATPGFFRCPKGVAVSASGEVFVCDYTANRVDVYDLSGQVLRSWGGTGTAPGKLREPCRLAVGSDESVYVTDSANGRVQRFSPTGDVLAIIGQEGRGRFGCPRGVAVGPDGLVYVTDGLRDRVVVFDENGHFVRQWGSTGTGPGRFEVPKDVAVAPGGRVYVLDCRRADVQMFSPTGRYLGVFGGQGSLRGRFDGPRGIFVGPDGHVFVADAYNNRVQELTDAGDFIRLWGCRGSRASQFRGPRDVAMAPDGSLVVTDTHNFRVQRFALSAAQDVTAPRTSPSIDPPLVHRWSRLPITFALAAADPDDGVAVTYLQKGGSLAWFLPYTAPVTLGQGIHVLRYLSVDTAGNQETTRRSIVRVDCTPPSVVPSRLVGRTVRRGDVLALPLTVADNLSPRCHFSARISQNGVVVAETGLGWRAVSPRLRDVTLGLHCDLRRGDYRLRLVVTDAAGNQTLRSGGLRVL